MHHSVYKSYMYILVIHIYFYSLSTVKKIPLTNHITMTLTIYFKLY